MASGQLGVSDLSATTNTTVYTVPASTLAALSINVCNRNASQVTIRLALAASGTPNAAEYIEYELAVSGYGAIERSGLVLDAGKQVVAYSSAANVSVVVVGFEEAA